MPWAKLEEDFEMYYRVDDLTDPWKAPQTVVLHHGNCKNSRFWYAWVPLLARHYRVVQLDARGFGRSTVPPPGYSWSLSGFARDLKLLLDHLQLDRVHLVGESMGGSIALQFAYEYPDRLWSLTVCDSPFRFTGPQILEAAEKQEKDGVLAFARENIARRLDPSETQPAFVEWYANEMGQTARHVAVETKRALAGNDLSPVLRQIRVPTLIFTAENRAYHFLQEVQEMHGLIENSKLVVFPGASGFIQHNQPERCAEAFLAFLQTL